MKFAEGTIDGDPEARLLPADVQREDDVIGQQAVVATPAPERDLSGSAR